MYGIMLKTEQEKKRVRRIVQERDHGISMYKVATHWQICYFQQNRNTKKKTKKEMKKKTTNSSNETRFHIIYSYLNKYMSIIKWREKEKGRDRERVRERNKQWQAFLSYTHIYYICMQPFEIHGIDICRVYRHSGHSRHNIAQSSIGFILNFDMVCIFHILLPILILPVILIYMVVQRPAGQFKQHVTDLCVFISSSSSSFSLFFSLSKSNKTKKNDTYSNERREKKKLQTSPRPLVQF